MGICCVLISTSDDTIERLHAEPALIWRWYLPDEPDPYLAEIGAGRKPGMLARLFGAVETPVPDPLPVLPGAGDGRLEVDLDKSWDGINFCLKRIAADRSKSLFDDGAAIGNVEVGYGPASSFSANDVANLAAAIAPVDSERLLAAFEPTAMRNTYPEALWERDDEDTREYLTEHFAALQSFLYATAEQGFGLIVIYT